MFLAVYANSSVTPNRMLAVATDDGFAVEWFWSPNDLFPLPTHRAGRRGDAKQVMASWGVSVEGIPESWFNILENACLTMHNLRQLIDRSVPTSPAAKPVTGQPPPG